MSPFTVRVPNIGSGWPSTVTARCQVACIAAATSRRWATAR